MKPSAAGACFNPRPTRRSSDRAHSPGTTIRRTCFNPRPTRRSSDSQADEAEEEDRVVSIRARPEGRAIARDAAGPPTARAVSIRARPEGRAIDGPEQPEQPGEAVSIRARPEGRAIGGSRGPCSCHGSFNPRPTRRSSDRVERYLAHVGLRFQSAPDPKVER